MQGSKYAPTNISEYGKNDLNANFKGMKFTASSNQTTNNDLLISDDHLIDGASLAVLNGVSGDKIHFQVIDKDNVLGYGANTILSQFVTDWYVNPDQALQLDFENQYPAKIYSGLYLRIVYVSIGTEINPEIITNFKLHKVLW